jgi:hypothetical protein
MFEYQDGSREQSRRAFPASGAADESDAKAQARRALQDAYDWRDDEPRAALYPTPPARSAAAAERSASARAAARRNRRESARSISRTVGV